MSNDVWERAREIRKVAEDGRPLYERIANVLSDAIRSGELADGHRLPTVRELAELLEISATTVVSAYNRLRADGLAIGEVGRGTFVSHSAGAPTVATDRQPLHIPSSSLFVPASTAWRRRALASAETRLRLAFPDAVDLMRGGPDPALLPTTALRRAWRTAADNLTVAELQYPMRVETDPTLVEQLLPRLEADGVAAESGEILITSSTQQLLALVVELLHADRTGTEPVIAAVEEPGYQTAMDTFERGGLHLVGMPLDDEGVRPEGLEAALAKGARLVLFTPRAHSPTGSSWTTERKDELAEVLAAYPDVWIVEDDHFAEASTSKPGSLRNDPRLRARVIYVRSFSKCLAPDLRLAAAVADDEVRSRLSLAKSFADGWTPRTAQRALAALLADPETDRALDLARSTYAARRSSLGALIQERTGGVISPVIGADGLHLWFSLPAGGHAGELVAETARAGFLLAGADPFYVGPGHDRSIRLNAGVAPVEVTVGVAQALADALRHLPSRSEMVLTP
ncbi:PLP-dependent aminotransferase family protein [Kribbella sancticallisti]|uniref:PLP-dependent aminotransferase family protein n=1 Tax=Kribbella sancticallisti TaxID=460087 RepID=A0ABN2EMP4_9ACTN